jgi:hypothetical protein
VKSSIYHSPTRFKNTNRVFEQRFDRVAEWKASHHSTGGMRREGKRLGIPSRSTAILTRAENLRGGRTGGSWRPGPLQMLLVTGILAFLGVTFLILSYDIDLAPDKLTFHKDAAALESLEPQSRQDDSRIETRSLPSSTASSAGLQPEEILQSAPPKPSLIARLAGSVDRKRGTNSGAARK